jgi:hypothetical protein
VWNNSDDVLKCKVVPEVPTSKNNNGDRERYRLQCIFDMEEVKQSHCMSITAKEYPDGEN